MKILDRYVIRQFILATLVSLVAFLVIFVAIDLMEKLDKFIDRKVPFTKIVDYYINFTPQMISLVLPIALLLLGTLPVLALLLLLGGITPGQVAQSWLIIVATAFAAGSLGGLIALF